MPKYYCDYCDTYLTHDSPSVRKTHCTGRKHKDNVKFYYQKWMEEQAQHLIDATTAAFKAGKIANNPFAQAGKGVAIPPPAQLTMGQRPGGPGMLPPGKRQIFVWFGNRAVFLGKVLENMIVGTFYVLQVPPKLGSRLG